MKKKILYIGGFELPDKNAAAQRVMANARLLREMNFDVSFIGISKDIENAPSLVDGFESTPVPYPNSTVKWFKQITTFVDSKEIINRNPDYVILYNFPAVASLKILRKCHKHGIKVIHDLTEWESAISYSPREIVHWLDINLRMRYAVKKMDGVIAISRLLFDYYKKYTQTILVPPTVDLCATKWNRERKLFSNNPKKLVYAGSIGMGNKDRLDMIIEVLKSHKDITLDVIGLSQQQYVNAFGKESPLSENVHFWGRISHNEAVLAVQNADFQLLIREDTLKNNAGFPTKFVESMSCCTPIIATPTSNICDYLKDGENGFIVSASKSLDDVFYGISVLSSEEIIKMKEACRLFEGFDYRNYKTELEKIFV